MSLTGLVGTSLTGSFSFGSSMMVKRQALGTISNNDLYNKVGGSFGASWGPLTRFFFGGTVSLSAEACSLSLLHAGFMKLIFSISVGIT